MNAATDEGGLAALQANFLGRARSDTVSILELCESAVHSPRVARVACLGEASRLLHRLAGTAGTFGLADFGLQARQLHAVASAMAIEPGSEFSERLIGLSDGVRELARTLDVVVPAVETAEKESSRADWRQSATPFAVCVLGFEGDSAARMCKALAGFGYSTRHVERVADLVDMVAADEVSGVLVRLGQGSNELLAGLNRLRAMQETPAPVVAVSPSSDFSDYLAAARAGIDGYFVEPTDLPRIESRLAFLMEKRRRESLRVLLVDDDCDLLSACKHILRGEGMAVETACEPDKVIPLLSEFQPDVIVMDIDMPECTGPELAQVIRLHDEWTHVPILYMSAQSDGADKLLATRKAGEAFLSKPIDSRDLVASICAHGRNARQMIEAASRDTLTGLLKRSFIEEMLDGELERAQRQGHSTCVAMIDLDHFKSVNDTHGHLVGDVVIRTLAAVLRQRLRLIDGIGRVGGEEFLAVLSGCTGNEALAIMEEVRKQFASIDFDGASGTFQVSLSAGIAAAGPGESSRAALIGAADKALYSAKDAGRDRVHVSPGPE